MKSDEILEIIPSTEFPIGLGGCYVEQTNFDCCVYDITIFDHRDESESIIEKNNKLFKIHHSSLDEKRVEVLIQLQNMQILSDEQWELQMFLAKINEKDKIFYLGSNGKLTKNDFSNNQLPYIFGNPNVIERSESVV